MARRMNRRSLEKPGVVRGFSKAMTQFAKEFPEEIYVSVSVLDDPTAIVPNVHIWRSDRLPWFETTDDFPRYLQFKSDGILE